MTRAAIDTTNQRQSAVSKTPPRPAGRSCVGDAGFLNERYGGARAEESVVSLCLPGGGMWVDDR
jgi:hypothetical protein